VTGRWQGSFRSGCGSTKRLAEIFRLYARLLNPAQQPMFLDFQMPRLSSVLSRKDVAATANSQCTMPPAHVSWGSIFTVGAMSLSGQGGHSGSGRGERVPTSDASRCSKLRVQKLNYSITSSARASRACGTVMPSDFAVLRLITHSIFVSWITGRSAGFSALRMRAAQMPVSL
jgi:hypothetical protein